MKQPSAADTFSFRALDGSELGEVLAQHIDKAVREVMTHADNHFSSSKAYPVCSVNVIARIGLYHDTRTEIPHKSVDIPIRFWTFVRPDEKISGLESVLCEDVRFSFDIGRSVDSAPDAIREQAQMLVIQPQKDESGVVVDKPVGDVSKADVTCSKCGEVARSKAGRTSHERWCKVEKNESNQLGSAA